MAEEIERLNYYQLQFLGADDFKAEQLYHRDMRRRHNLGPHTWGIVTGLELEEVLREDGAYDVYIQPGYAIDGFGREIIVLSQYKLTADDFRFTRPKKPFSYTVHIAYAEEAATPPAFGYGSCDGGQQNDRVRELYRIVIDAAPPFHAPIVAEPATKDPPDDESVPHQDLPDSAATRWLVPLGHATWDGTKFSQDADGTLGRVYAGLVAAKVFAPDGKLVIRPRVIASPPPDPEPEFAEVQGRLQVDGTLVAVTDVHVHGGQLFADGAGGEDGNVPLWLSRLSGDSTEHDLRIHIGPESGPDRHKHRLTVGPGPDPVDRDTEQVVFAVSADNKVHIPDGVLEFGMTDRQMITVEGNKWGIGLEKGTTLFSRTDSEFAWYRGNALAMQLDGSSKLTVTGGVEAKSLRLQNDANVRGNVNVDGALRLLLNGGDDSDELAITRFNKSQNSNDLRVILGDDLGNDDAFTIGPVWNAQYRENFRVSNNGHVSAEGDLTIKGKTTLTGAVTLGGALTVAQPAQLQSLTVTGAATLSTATFSGAAAFASTVTFGANAKLAYGSVSFPIDIKTGTVTSTANAPSGTTTFSVTTDLPQTPSKVFAHVGLASVRQTAASSSVRWSVDFVSAVVDALDDKKFTITVNHTVKDGSVEAFNWIVFFIP